MTELAARLPYLIRRRPSHPIRKAKSVRTAAFRARQNYSESGKDKFKSVAVRILTVSQITAVEVLPGPALADAEPNARPRRGAPLTSDAMTSSCSVNRVTIAVERRYVVQR